jgi:hypothetical protein
MEQSSCWETISRPASQEVFEGTRRFVAFFTIVSHWTLLWATRIWSTISHSVSLRSILILNSSQRLGLSCGLSHSGFSDQDFVHISYLSHRVICRAYITIHHFITLIRGEEYSSCMCSQYLISVEWLVWHEITELYSRAWIFKFL